MIHPSRLARGIAIAAALMLVAAAPTRQPAPTRQQVIDAERSRAQLLGEQKAAQARAAVLAGEERKLGAERVTTAARLRELEQATAVTVDRVADLARRQKEAQKHLAERAAELAPFLPVVERLALYPSETLLAVPMPPEDAVRGVLVLGGLMRRLEADAVAIRSEQQNLVNLGAELDSQLPELARRQTAQAASAAALDAQLQTTAAGRRSAESLASDSARHAAAEAARADGLRAAIIRLETERQQAEAAAREAAARDAAARDAKAASRVADARNSATRDAASGDRRASQEALARPPVPTDPVGSAASGGPAGLITPVAGSLVRGFGDSQDGGTSSGIGYLVPPGARVVSPCGGRVVFAAPFRSFGLLMIIDCGGGWHAVLSGFERLDASLGQRLQPGEPVGAMPGFDPQSGRGRPTLSLELRRDGNPVNPTPYLHAKS